MCFLLRFWPKKKIGKEKIFPSEKKNPEKKTLRFGFCLGGGQIVKFLLLFLKCDWSLKATEFFLGGNTENRANGKGHRDSDTWVISAMVGGCHALLYERLL